tara:strand:+ start:968 stop:1609 length:642 start_codon:yes stop_codon:yes gene_type:complete
MAFWGDSGIPGGVGAQGAAVTEPKRAYRWLMRINAIEEWIVKKVTKPGFDITETTHQFLNHTFYYPGRMEWQTIDVTLVDPVQPDSTHILSRIVENSGYHVPAFETPGNGWTTLSKNAAVDALNKIQIEQINALGDEVESWTLHNPWVKSVKYGDLDYTSDEMVEITLTLRYDWASLQTQAGKTFRGLTNDSGVGGNAGKGIHDVSGGGELGF